MNINLNYIYIYLDDSPHPRNFPKIWGYSHTSPLCVSSHLRLPAPESWWNIVYFTCHTWTFNRPPTQIVGLSRAKCSQIATLTCAATAWSQSTCECWIADCFLNPWALSWCTSSSFYGRHSLLLIRPHLLSILVGPSLCSQDPTLFFSTLLYFMSFCHCLLQPASSSPVLCCSPFFHCPCPLYLLGCSILCHLSTLLEFFVFAGLESSAAKLCLSSCTFCYSGASEKYNVPTDLRRQ